MSDLIRWRGCRCPCASQTSPLWGPVETSVSLGPQIKPGPPGARNRFLSSCAPLRLSVGANSQTQTWSLHFAHRLDLPSPAAVTLFRVSLSPEQVSHLWQHLQHLRPLPSFLLFWVCFYTKPSSGAGPTAPAAWALLAGSRTPHPHPTLSSPGTALRWYHF